MNSGNFFRIIFFLSLAFLLYSAEIHSQTYIYSNTFGKFKSATSFTITSAGFIYITDSGTDEVYKLDTLGNLLKYAGGYGWDEGLFDNPSDVYANPLSVYVCDKNNHRVERFDKDLNFIWQLYTRNSDTTAQRFGYPLGCAVSPQGDLYVLDSENKRVVKFDLFGNFNLNFGGYDAGIYSLNDPKKLAVSENDEIYVGDDKRIVVFDQYGNGISIIKMNDKISGLRIIFNNLTVNSDSTIYLANLNIPDLSLTKLKLLGSNIHFPIIESLIFNNKLYILTRNNIEVFIPSN